MPAPPASAKLGLLSIPSKSWKGEFWDPPGTKDNELSCTWDAIFVGFWNWGPCIPSKSWSPPGGPGCVPCICCGSYTKPVLILFTILSSSKSTKWSPDVKGEFTVPSKVLKLGSGTALLTDAPGIVDWFVYVWFGAPPKPPTMSKFDFKSFNPIIIVFYYKYNLFKFCFKIFVSWLVISII